MTPKQNMQPIKQICGAYLHQIKTLTFLKITCKGLGAISVRASNLLFRLQKVNPNPYVNQDILITFFLFYRYGEYMQ